MSNPCTASGWFWFCDIHDTHGNADTRDEAEFIAGAHEEFMDTTELDPEGCDLIIHKVKGDPNE